MFQKSRKCRKPLCGAQNIMGTPHYWGTQFMERKSVIEITGSLSSICIADYELERFVWERKKFVLKRRSLLDRLLRLAVFLVAET